MSELVLYEHVDGVALITFNRPERRNAWGADIELRYHEMLAAAAADAEVRAIVVTGAGAAFCVGADVNAMASSPVVRGVPGAARPARRPAGFPRSIRKPVIAAVNGACAGVGLVNALMCDIRFAAAGAKMTTAFARRGLAAEHGVAWLLNELVGYGRATELLISGRVFLAEEAFDMGLVSAVVPPERLLEHTLAYARELAGSCSPQSMALLKQQMQVVPEQGYDQALELGRRYTDLALRSPDVVEGSAAWREKRPPRFAGLAQTTDPDATRIDPVRHEADDRTA